MYWTLRFLPELADLPRSERRMLWRQCFRHGFRHWQVWVAFIICGLCAAFGGWLGDALALSSPWAGPLGAAIGGGLGGFFAGSVHAHFTRPYLREARDRLN